MIEPKRTTTIDADPRGLSVGFESTVFDVAAESRYDGVAYESRTFSVAPSLSTLMVRAGA